jgi:hypothetical protein
MITSSDKQDWIIKTQDEIIEDLEGQLQDALRQLRKSNELAVRRTNMITAMTKSLRASQNVKDKVSFLKSRFTKIVQEKDGFLEYVMGEV